MMEGGTRESRLGNAEPGVYAKPDQSSSEVSESLDRALLSEILAQTRATLQEFEAITPDEMARLRNVVAQYPDGTETLSEVVSDLVEVILEIRFGTLFLRSDFRREMAVLIAQTIVEDPTSRRRLESFCSKLSEDSS